MEKLDDTNSVAMPDGTRVFFEDHSGPYCSKGSKGPRWDAELGKAVEDPGCWDEDD